MFGKLLNVVRPTRGSSLGRAFTRLGWAGFWLQVVFGSLPILLMGYYFLFGQTGNVSRSGLAFVEYLTLVNLVLLLFTIFWSYRYVRMGRRIADPPRRPALNSVINTVWIGLLAGSMGMLFSMGVMMIEAANLLFFFLNAPQGGIPVIQTSGSDVMAFVSTVDMVSLMALILTLFAELLMLVFSLWLLFRTSLDSAEYPQT